jgi:hypothetical protein
MLPAVSLLAGCCVGCTILTSETFEQLKEADRAPSDVFYVLPKGVVDVTLSVVQASGQFTLTIDNLNYIPDKKHEYYLHYLPHPSYEDTINVQTDENGFLQEVDSTTEDKTPAAIEALAQAVAQYGGLEAAQLDTTSETLLKLTLDPLDGAELKAAAAGATDRIKRYVKNQLKYCSYYDDGPTSPSSKSLEFLKNKRDSLQATLQLLTAQKALTDKQVTDATSAAQLPDKKWDCAKKGLDPSLAKLCTLITEQANLADDIAKTTADLQATKTAISNIELARSTQASPCAIYTNLASDLPKVRIEILDHTGQPAIGREGSRMATASGGDTAKQVDPDCAVGICYRPKETFKIVYSLGAGDDTTIVELPNRAPIVEIDIGRAFFIKKIQNMSFAKGFLKKMVIDKPSELLAVSKLPLDVASSIETGLQARAKLITNQTNVAKDKAALLKAQSSLNQTGTTKNASSLQAATVSKRTAPAGATSRRVEP